MKSRNLAALALVSAIAAGTLCAYTFTDLKGRTLEAEFLGMEGQTALLRLKKTGKTAKVPLDKLSAKDQAYLKEHPLARLPPIKLPAKPIYAVSQVTDNKFEWQFIDAAGNALFDRTFDSVLNYGFWAGAGEYAAVQDPFYGIIDSQGKVLFGVESTGIARVEAGSDSPIFIGQFGAAKEVYYRYLGPDGKPLFPGDYKMARPFRSGRAWVCKTEDDLPNEPDLGNWTLIDAKGNEIVSLPKVEVQDFSEDRAAIAGPAAVARWSVIGLDGKVVAKGPFNFVSEFQNGVAIVDEKLMDKTGKWILGEDSNWRLPKKLADSHDGVVIARRAKPAAGETNYAILQRTTGEHMADIPNDYFLDEGFHNGFVRVNVTKTRQYAYLNRTGVLAIPAKFTAAARFRNGFAEVGLQGAGGVAIINTTGQVIWPKPEEKK